jgi:uncharacterized membrane protein
MLARPRDRDNSQPYEDGQPKMNRTTLGGVALIAIWAAIVVMAEWRSGLVHVPLAAGFVFIARGIALAGITEKKSG